MRDRMHKRVVARLNDGQADYLDKQGIPVCAGLTVIVDNNLLQGGPEGLIRTTATGVTWRKAELATVDRGGVFVHCCRRLLIEEIILDDGHMMTAACMESP